MLKDHPASRPAPSASGGKENASRGPEHAEDDERLVAEFLSGNEPDRACAALVGRYWRPVVGWIWLRVRSEHDAEDIAQEAFVRAFRSLAGLRRPQCFAAWLFRIAANGTTDFLRHRRTAPPLEALPEDGSLACAEGTAVSDALERRELADEVLRAVARLPERYRMAVVLRYLVDMPASEIARQLGEPEGTVRNRLFRALGKLRRMLGTVSGPRRESQDRRSSEDS